MATHEIAMRLDHIAQLYDVLDPSPFPEKSLNADVEAYLLDCAGELSHPQRIELVVSGPADSIGAQIPAMAAAIHAHFLYLLTQAERQWRRKSRVAHVATAAGVLVLVSAFVLRGLIEIAVPAAAITEGLLVLGWVALWRPIEHLVFDRIDHRAHCALLGKLADVPVRFVPQ